MDNSLEKFKKGTKEEDLLEIFADWLKDSQSYHDELLKKQKISYQYYIGNQTDVDDVPAYLSNTVENRIFEAVETIVPIVTAGVYRFMVLPGSELPESKERAKKLQTVLSRKYETLEVQSKCEDTTRQMLLYRFGVLKYFWNDETEDIDVKMVDSRLILVPKLRCQPENLPYVIELQCYSKAELEDYFPKIKVDELPIGKTKVDTGEIDSSSTAKEYQVFECWTNETVAWFCGTKLLDIKENPNYDFEGMEKKVLNREKGKIVKETKFYNHLDNPEKPYVFFATYNVSDGCLPSTSLVEIGIPIQDAINAQKRAIINNLKQMGSGQVHIDSEAMTEEEANNITNEPGLVIRGKGLASENRIRREPGVQLPSDHFSNLQHSESVFDNIMGTHSATRGQAQANTLGQDIMSKQQDYTRVDMITRVLNRGISKLANGLVQLMKLNYTENQLVKLIGEEGAAEFIQLNQDDIENYIEIIVKSDNNLPMDEVSLRAEAVQLWQLGAISPETLFERLKFSNPRKEAEKVLAWKKGQLDMETQANIAQAQATAPGAPGMPVEPAEAETPETAGEGRGTESILDVLSRARKTLKSPVTSNVPNTNK